ncbi:ESF1-like protein [Hypsibius exemplaris]|uniref:ESF1-like protein n=1 Tax=Hypsibius exemplaris TaxID=2072580 RepID=A0A1W0WX69_HYPEX|nr:ESF1-like protein [Hypsibius exemplaris]
MARPAGSGRPSKKNFNPKLKKNKKAAAEKQNQEHILKDDRFSRIATDPRFRGIPKEERKLKIDDRFKAMFTDKRFDQKHTVDKRGRPVNFSTSDNLKKFYHLEEEEGGEAATSSTKRTKKKHSDLDKRFKVKSEDSEESDTETEDDDDDPSRDLARGKGNMESSSDESEDEDEETAEEIEHPWAEFSQDAPPTDEATRRLALVNMDWDGIKAEDLLALFTSFKPTSGVINSVTIYPSEYGLKRMEEEKKKGPLELTRVSSLKKGDDSDSDDSDDEADDASKARGNEQLREYQLNRLKYYYAVIECDTAETASKIYEECDGLEYENSSTVIDLRYIPEDMEFEQEARSAATNLPANYVASEFVNSALQQSTVKCSWDETPRDRKGLPAFADWEKQDDLQAYLASSSDEEDEEEAAPFLDAPNGDTKSVRSTRSMKDPEAIEKYRALLLGLDTDDGTSKPAGDSDSDGNVDLEVEWEPDVKSAAANAVEKHKKAAEVEKLTPFEKLLEKQAVKRKARKEAKLRESTPDFDRALADEGDDDLVDSDNDESVVEGGDAEEEDPRTAEEVAAEVADLELLVGGRRPGEKRRHFSLSTLLKEGKEGKESKSQLRKKRKLAARSKTSLVKAETPAAVDDFEMDLQDPRFAALYTSSQYNVDKSDAAFKATKGMDALVREKVQRRGDQQQARTSSSSRDGRDVRSVRPEISSLAKSVKAKIASDRMNKKN